MTAGLVFSVGLRGLRNNVSRNSGPDRKYLANQRVPAPMPTTDLSKLPKPKTSSKLGEERTASSEQQQASTKRRSKLQPKMCRARTKREHVQAKQGQGNGQGEAMNESDEQAQPLGVLRVTSPPWRPTGAYELRRLHAYFAFSLLAGRAG